MGLDSSRILIINKKNNIKKHHPFGTSIEIQKYPTCLLHRREPARAKALKLNFFTNYYFFLLRIFPPPSLKIESNSLYIQLFYERKKFFDEEAAPNYDCLGATRVIFVLPLFAIPLLS